MSTLQRWRQLLESAKSGLCVEEQLKECLLILELVPFMLDAWMFYLNCLKQSNTDIPLDVWCAALQSTGMDPRSGMVWLEAIRCAIATEGAADTASELYQAAIAAPQLHANVLWTMSEAASIRRDMRQPLQKALEAAQATLRSEGQWPDMMTCVDPCTTPAAVVGCVREEWDRWFRKAFATLEHQTLDPALQRRRIELAFRHITAQFFFDDSLWVQFATFMMIQTRDLEAALAIVRQGILECGHNSIALHNVERMLLGEMCDPKQLSVSLASLSEDDRRLVQQRISSYQYNGSKKSFRDIGKQAEAANVTDWRVYQQWAEVEARSSREDGFVLKVLERGLACTASDATSYDQLSLCAEKFFLSRHAEGELLSVAERRVERASKREWLGASLSAWNQMLELERVLGIPWSGKTETRSAGATQERNTWRIQQALRFRVSGLLTISPREVDMVYFAKDVEDALMDPSSDMLELRSDKRRRLDPPRRSSGGRVDHPLEAAPGDAWLPFAAPENSHPPSAASNDEDVCGSRTLRGCLVHKLSRDELVEARVAREEVHRSLVRQLNSRRDTASSESLPRQLGRLVATLSQKTQYSPEQVALLERLSVRWLMSTLSKELDLGVLIRPNDGRMM